MKDKPHKARSEFDATCRPHFGAGGRPVVPVSHSVNDTGVVFNAPGITVRIPIRAEHTAEQASAEIRRALKMLPLEARGTLRWDGAAWRDA